MKASTIEARIIVRNANGGDSDVTVKDAFRPGEMISERIAVIAAEAGALASEALRLSDDRSFVRDRSRR